MTFGSGERKKKKEKSKACVSSEIIVIEAILLFRFWIFRGLWGSGGAGIFIPFLYTRYNVINTQQ